MFLGLEIADEVPQLISLGDNRHQKNYGFHPCNQPFLQQFINGLLDNSYGLESLESLNSVLISTII